MRESDRLRIRGSAFDTTDKQRQRNWERCVVIEVHPNTYTCDVATETGKFITDLPWPAVARSPTGLAGEVSVPQRGAAYELHRELNEARLGACIQPMSSSAPTAAQHQVFFNGEPVGGLDPTYDATGRRSYRGGLPPDVLPGDWVRVGEQGNMVGVLGGGVTILKATELAKVIANATGDMLQLIGRNTQMHSDFGTVEFKNDDGHVSMVLRGGSQQTTETSASEENWTVRADLGHSGELADFRITDTQGHTLAQVHFSPNGDVTRVSTGHVEETVGGIYDVKAGAHSLAVDKDSTLTATNITAAARGSITTRASGNNTHTAGTDAGLFAARDLSFAAGRNLTMSVGGQLTNTAGDNAFTTTIVNGSWEIDIGSVAAGDVQGAKSGFSLSTFTGDIGFSSTAGNITLRTNTTDSVQLGGQTPAYHAMLFEMFMEFMEIFGNVLDTHIHPTNTGPSGPPAVLPYGTTKQKIQDIMSKYVTLGG